MFDKCVFALGACHHFAIEASVDKPFKVYVLPYLYPYVSKTLDMYKDIPYSYANGVVEFDFSFVHKGRFIIALIYDDKPVISLFDIRGQAFLTKQVFVLEKEFLSFIPQKIEMHSHTTCSDGTYSPEFMCCAYREAGFDSLAITDHFTKKGSIVAQAAFDGKCEMNIMPGEETHTDFNDPHVVNVGCNYSVNDIIINDIEAHKKKVYAKIKEKGLEGKKFAYNIAELMVRVDMIRASGGKSIFAHPFWRVLVNTLDIDFVDYIFQNVNFDYFEFLGGNTIEDNQRQINYARKYMDKFPCVGNSDAHDTEKLFDEIFTIVFAKSNSQNDLFESIDNFKCVACEHRHGSEYRCFGDFWLTEYAQFYLDVMLPQLLPIYKAQADLMRQSKLNCHMDDIKKAKLQLIDL